MGKDSIGLVQTPPTNAGNTQANNVAVDLPLELPGAQIQIVTNQTLATHDGQTVKIELCYSHLKDSWVPFRSDKFIRISRIDESGDSTPIYETEVLKINSNSIWKPIILSIQQIGSEDNPLLIECFNFDSNGNHVLKGKIQKSVRDLEQLHQEGIAAILDRPVSGCGLPKVGDRKLFVSFLETGVF